MPDDSDKVKKPFDDSLPAQAGKPSGYLGSALKGRYLIEREVGRGGFGVAYLAKDQQLHGRPVVIKILTQDYTEDPWTLKKFRQEIEALARIDHPGVVGALDTGDTEDGKPFLVMQYVEGVTLRSEIRSTGLPLHRVASITRLIGQALSAAHDKGVWHRDLKPENIMLQKMGDGEEYVKLIDFGIAAIKDSQFSTKDSKTTRVAGSIAYMAPEQFQGKPGAQSDVWAFGIIVWEMLTTRKPFSAESLFDLMMQQQKGVATRPRDLRPDLPEAAEEALLKALAPDPIRRFQRAKDFGDAFARAIGSPDSAPPTRAVPTAPLTGPVSMSRMTTSGSRMTTSGRLEMAHVLFLDIVGYSTLPMDEQKDYLAELQELVRETDTFQEAERNGELLRLPTGDGMALTFFGDPMAPVECAVQLARALKSRPHLKLRTGVHSGPVYRVADINANLNVSGGGINMAQRVMDCGDAGHILVSDVVAGTLKQLGAWRGTLHDLGEVAVKHGVLVRVHNLVTEDAGNAALPKKVAAARTAVAPAPQPSRRGLFAGLGAAAVVAGGASVYFLLRDETPPPPPPPKVMREITYSITLQRFKNGAPDGSPTRIPHEVAVTPGTGLRLNLTISEPGHLYLFNHGPEGDIVFLRPNPAQKVFSSMASGEAVEVPGGGWFTVDAQQGAENLYLVWADKPVPQLDDAAAGVGGRLVDNNVYFDRPERVKELLDFAGKHLATTTEERDEARQLTTLRSTTGILAYRIKFEHY